MSSPSTAWFRARPISCLCCCAGVWFCMDTPTQLHIYTISSLTNSWKRCSLESSNRSCGSPKGKWRYQHHKKKVWIWGNNNNCHYISFLLQTATEMSLLIILPHICFCFSIFKVPINCLANLNLDPTSCCSHGGLTFVQRCPPCVTFWVACSRLCCRLFKGLDGALEKCNLADCRVCVLLIAIEMTWL